MQLCILKITTLTAYLIQVFPFLTSDDREKLQVLQNQADLLVLAKKKDQALLKNKTIAYL